MAIFGDLRPVFAASRVQHISVGLRASGNLPVSYVLTGNLPEIYHIVYFLVISNYIGGDIPALNRTTNPKTKEH